TGHAMHPAGIYWSSTTLSFSEQNLDCTDGMHPADAPGGFTFFAPTICLTSNSMSFTSYGGQSQTPFATTADGADRSQTVFNAYGTGTCSSPGGGVPAGTFQVTGGDKSITGDIIVQNGRVSLAGGGGAGQNFFSGFVE